MTFVDCRSATLARVRSVAARMAWFTVGGAGLIAGCAGPSAPEHFFALNDGAVVVGSTNAPVAAGHPASATQPPLPGIIVTAVTIPELVDRPQIVTRDASNRVVVSEQNLWAESIRSGVARTLAIRIGRTMQEAGHPVEVSAYPQVSVRDPVLKVTVDIIRFEAEPNGEAIVDALWSIRRPADDMVRTGHTVASSPINGTSYEAIIGGWNKSVGTLEQDIAEAVAKFGVDTPGASPAR